MTEAASACKVEGFHTDVYHRYTEHLLLSKKRLLNTLTYSIKWCLLYNFIMEYGSMHIITRGDKGIMYVSSILRQYVHVSESVK